MWNPVSRRVALVFSLCSLLLLPCASAQERSTGGSVGIFSGSTDIGETMPGKTIYDPKTGTYTVTGGGADMWGGADQFHFTWVRLSGDATLDADIEFPAGAAIPKEKAVLLFRQSLAPDAPYADIAIHGDGHIDPQSRATPGATTVDTEVAASHSQHLRLRRAGNTFHAYASTPDGSMIATPTSTVDLRDPVYVGIGVCAHNKDGLLTIKFRNVKLVQGR